MLGIAIAGAMVSQGFLYGTLSVLTTLVLVPVSVAACAVIAASSHGVSLAVGVWLGASALLVNAITNVTIYISRVGRVDDMSVGLSIIVFVLQVVIGGLALGLGFVRWAHRPHDV